MLARIAHEYAVVAARAARLLPGLADVPPAIRRGALGEPFPRASELVREVGRLRIALDGAVARAGLDGAGPGGVGFGGAGLGGVGGDGPRARFLAAQLRALEATARRLAGQDVGFAADVADTFGLIVRSADEDGYRRAHRELAELLPGPGPLARRVATYRKRAEVAPGLLLPALQALSHALRERVPWALPPGECVEYRLAGRAPWVALHSWLGAGRSLVTVNVTARLRWDQLPGLVAHEAYPGHHVQRCRAELVGLPEQRVTLLRSPQSVVAEGAAEAGLDVLVGPGWGAWAREALAGTVAFDGALAERFDTAWRALAPARLDAALLLHDRRVPPAVRAERARYHLGAWLLVDAARAARIVEGLGVPLWRGYVAAHVEGPSTVNSWLRAGAGAGVQRYARLLDEPLLPADLRADVDTGTVPVAAERVPAGARA
ncbi:MAG: DUF885 domain-containing protein [Pseudonocardia sp.]